VWWELTVTTVHGVDFSGADSGGSAKIVVASRHDDGPVTIRRGLDRSRLRRMIRDSAETSSLDLWRIDAPFSLPEVVYERHGIEPEWLALAHWMDSFESAREWRRALRAVNRKEPKRACDRAARTPMAPMNLRVFKQTWTVVCEILLPLAEDGLHIAPVHVTDSTSIITEGCPASALAFRGESSRGYKGRDDANQERRLELARRLDDWGVPLSEEDHRAASGDPEGDVLDALLLLTEPSSLIPPVEARLEAWVW
jgi:hypothetical protein